MSLSSITISGTLTEDPEKRFTPTNVPVANLRIEICYIPRGQQEEPLSSQVVRVNAWRDLAEECEQKYKAGDKLLITGKAQINAYTTNEGKKKRELEIDANSVVKLSNIISIQPPPKKQEQKSNNSFKKADQDPEQITNFDEVVSTSEEIPF